MQILTTPLRMSTLKITSLMMLIYLYISQVSGKMNYMANKDVIHRLSQANESTHWNIYIDELLYHVKGLNNIEARLHISLHVIGRAMQWCQLPDRVRARSALALHVKDWVPCGSLVWNMDLSYNYKMHNVITVRVCDQFHMTLELQEVNIESKVHRKNLWRRRKLWHSSDSKLFVC